MAIYENEAKRNKQNNTEQNIMKQSTMIQDAWLIH